MDADLELEARRLPRSDRTSTQSTHASRNSNGTVAFAKQKKLRSEGDAQLVRKQQLQHLQHIPSDKSRSESRNNNDKPRSDKGKSIAGHPKHRLYLDSGASIHITFNKDLLNERYLLHKPMKISAAGKPLEIKEVSTLYKALKHLPLPKDNIYYEPEAIENLLSFARLADEYYIVCNTQINDAIYVRSKEDGKYLRFKRCKG